MNAKRNCREIGILFIIIGLLCYWRVKVDLAVCMFLMGGVILIIGYTWNAAASTISFVWSEITHLIGTLNTLIILAIVYFILIVPTGLLIRFCKWSLYDDKKRKRIVGWIEVKGDPSFMKNQY